MIGIFDSGLGGLTALKELRRLAPCEEIIYFGDTGRVPYGTRSESTIIRYARQDASFLVSKGVNAIVVACGTASTTALEALKKEFDIPIIGVVEPAAEAAVKATKNGKIAVIGTTATIRSGAFPRAINAIDPGISVYTRDCPLFVPLVENGFTAHDCEITSLVCEHYLHDIRTSGADTIILGCTHYPIIAHNISHVLPSVTLINTGAEAARAAVNALPKSGSGNASVHYYVSDDPLMFASSASMFLGENIRDDAEKVDIEKY